MQITSKSVLLIDRTQLKSNGNIAIKRALDWVKHPYSLCLADIDNELWITAIRDATFYPICQTLDIAPSLGKLMVDKESNSEVADWVIEQPFRPEQAMSIISDPELEKILEDEDMTAGDTRRGNDRRLRHKRLILEELKEMSDVPECIIKAHEECIAKLEKKRYQYNKGV